jgi:Bacterial Ig-like domain (group 2)
MFRAAITASIISIIVLGSYPTLTDAASQSTTQLQITSPASNAIVHPGQTLAITVVSPSNTGFSNVAVIGEDPIGFSNVANSLPAQVSLAIPANIACRRYMLTAVGSTSSGQNAQSPTILIDVERPDMPSALSTSISGISFQVIGEKGPMILLATFQDGSTLDVTESSNVAYASSNASVANIDPNGIVTAVAPGSASITATYTLATARNPNYSGCHSRCSAVANSCALSHLSLVW